MAQATCQFRDGPHVCGEPSVGEVGLAIAPGASQHNVAVCERHQAQLDDVYERSAPLVEPPVTQA